MKEHSRLVEQKLHFSSSFSPNAIVFTYWLRIKNKKKNYSPDIHQWKFLLYYQTCRKAPPNRKQASGESSQPTTLQCSPTSQVLPSYHPVIIESRTILQADVATRTIVFHLVPYQTCWCSSPPVFHAAQYARKVQKDSRDSQFYICVSANYSFMSLFFINWSYFPKLCKCYVKQFILCHWKYLQYLAKKMSNGNTYKFSPHCN